MATPDPITTAREALDYIVIMSDDNLSPHDSHFTAITAALDYAEGQAAEAGDNLAGFAAVIAEQAAENALIRESHETLVEQLEKLKAERDEWKGHYERVASEGDVARAEITRLKAERDEALCRLLSAGSEKPTAEDMDWAISLSASLRREEIVVEETEITRLKAERDEWKGNYERVASAGDAARAEITRLTSQLEQAERVIAPLYFDSTNVPFAIPDRRPLWMRADNGKYVELLHTTVGTLRAASQWIKDRQVKTDAIGDK